jgi:hypothetical protein
MAALVFAMSEQILKLITALCIIDTACLAKLEATTICFV